MKGFGSAALLLLLVACVLAAAEYRAQTRAVTRTECPRPDNITAMFEQINSELSSTGFLGTLYNNQAISIPAGEGPTYLDEDPNESKTCPTSLTTGSQAPLAHRSLCPFYFRTMVLPEGFFPTSLRTARCKCQKCVENTYYDCEPISVEVAVLKPVGCWHGLQRYEKLVVSVNMGCTCATAYNFDVMME